MNINVCTVFRKDKINKDQTAPIHLRFIENRKIRYQSTGICLPIEAWDFDRQTVCPTYPNATAIQYQIDTAVRQYEKRMARLEALEIKVSLATLLESKNPCERHTVEGYFARQIEHMHSIEKYATATKYRYTWVSLHKFRNQEMRFEAIDQAFLSDFEQFLRKEGVNDNSIATKFSVLKAVYNKALAEGVFVPKTNPFSKFKVGRLWIPTRKRAITKDEIHKLLSLELPKHRSPYLEFARDIFLFSYFVAGINFKDMATLTWGDIANGRIYYARHKTSKAMNCPLNEQAKRIVDKYRTDPSDDGYVFPILDHSKHKTERQKSNRIHKVLGKVNQRLGELGTLIGLKVNLTTYVARHTYATVLKRSGVSVALISESLGHSDLATTQIYLDSFENAQIDEAMKHLL